MNILRMFFQSGRDLSITECARTLSVDLDTITSHFDVLLEDGLIEETAQEKVTSPKYRLTHLGRNYAVENLAKRQRFT